MEPGGSANATVIGRFRSWLSDWGFKEWRRAALVAVLVGTAAFGGLDTVNKRVTDLKPGEMFDTGRFEMTVQRASLVEEVRAGEKRLFAPKPGRRYLGLVVEMRNTGTLPGNVFNPVDLVGRPDAYRLSALRLADGTSAVQLGPGLHDEVVLLWDVPEGVISVGSEIPLRLRKEVRKAAATYSQGWVRSETEYGRLDVPVGGPR
ncbi:hypothetical protein V4U86_10970 [Mycobacterium sp. AMU20-3851]|uniref:hypothetical protein n=1 Tax=Mycobacterium sp. AMU20-3851 TaxID=3122055 RepID=UPI00375500C6